MATTPTPTPDEARRTLQDLEEHRRRTADAAGWHRGWWIGAGVIVAAYGVAVDLAPGGAWSSVIPAVLLVAAVVSTTRWGSAAIGRPLRARQAAGPGRWIVAIVGALLIVGVTLAVGRLDVPHLAAIAGVVGGVVLAVGGPWWQDRVLTRRATK
ncbi:hypothetical protein [Cryptosporangium phraense]|uniref:Uncharacterized protein n=1 Tax=Cryptosporangium phraense TaxID=2593070 RepID=A0A545ARM7_9ACTN|nr:hypothetical protein [Cryptosporangium phraense]TQS43957.1 hypothetical protein FL583_15975 [Cryptosporangium phraense]